MLVHQILNSKSDQGVITVLPGMSVGEVAAVLSKKRIGTVVVSASGSRADGILSERDIVRELGTRGVACMTDSAADIMTVNPVTCAPTDVADVVLAKMTQGRFRHMPVVKDGEMVGLITLGDVVKARLSELEVEREALEGMIMGH
ncbi:CBS domain-containing protein [Thalassobium sp. R2A62]|uniref:CBS domain-containing protein n=1 Tax=Thalassobium sp. R2A62 TaxID=633131 RepID=UPI0001B1D3BD|nr:CBS domain-containing protein [Thalassobium sp. R2A62]EET48920.1 CBS domain containing protein [Thalassobium sp. R2A62]